jgi:uncharacterized membrane protein
VTAERLRRLGDSVLIVGITLLSYNLAPPVIINGQARSGDVQTFFSNLYGLITSFFVIFMLWVIYLKILDYIDEPDDKVVSISLTFFILVLLTPVFAVAESQYRSWQSVMYLSILQITNSLLLVALWIYLAKHKNLLIRERLSKTDNKYMSYYFIQTLEQDSTLSEVFIPDVEEDAERLSIALKMWVGGITGDKATRKTHNGTEGEEEYTLEQRKADFKLADSYANKDEIFRAGVQVATILELIIRKKRNISLEGAKHDSSIWKYVRTGVVSGSVNQEDLLVCSGCVL